MIYCYLCIANYFLSSMRDYLCCIFFIVLVALGSCTSQEINKAMDSAEELMNSRPDSATLKAEWISEKELEQPETTQTEQGTTQTTTQNATQITAHKLTEVQQKIVNALISNPSASRKQLATLIGDITEDGIKYHLKKLQQTGVIARIGADNSGYWEVNQKVQQ